MIACGLGVPARRADLHALLDRYRAAGVRNFGVQVDLPERPNSSFHNMLRAGFDVAYRRPNFLPGETVTRRRPPIATATASAPAPA